jgi:alanine racemase
MIPQHGRLEISPARIAANVELFRNRLGKTQLCATVKADAYGHGAAIVVPALRRAGVAWFCVYSLGEALQVAPLAGDARILVLSPCMARPGATWQNVPGGGGELGGLAGRIRWTVVNAAGVSALDEFCGRHFSSPVAVHVQVDAGLTRAGVAPADALALLRHIGTLKHLRLEGLFAHFSHGDEAGHPSIQQQLNVLNDVARAARPAHPDLLVHLQNSGGAWNLGESGLHMARVGIALYGLQPSLGQPIAGLQPIARLVAPILDIHDRPANVGVGYGHTFVTRRRSRLAIVPVGYADGYPRALSNRGVVQVGGQNAPVVGRVSMDQIVVDATELPEAKAGDEVTVFSDDPAAPNCMDAVAAQCATIGYEIATGIGARVVRCVRAAS